MTTETINLFDVGCLLNLRVKMWSGRKMVTRADLVKVGYDPDQLPSELVNLGRKLMVPKAEISALLNIEQRARKALERWSVPFGIASAHFVPSTMIPTVEAQLKDLKEEFFTTVDSFISRFEALKETVKTSHPDFWDKCLKGHYPSNPQALRRYYQFDYYIFKVAGLESLDKATATQAKMHEEINNFVNEYVSTMRQETIKFCDLMTARVNGKPLNDEAEAKKLTPRSIAAFRKYIDRFRNMNIFGDGEIEKMLTEFQSTFLDGSSSVGGFESATVKDGVSKALEAIREKAACEGENASQFVDQLCRKVVL